MRREDSRARCKLITIRSVFCQEADLAKRDKRFEMVQSCAMTQASCDAVNARFVVLIAFVPLKAIFPAGRRF